MNDKQIKYTSSSRSTIYDEDCGEDDEKQSKLIAIIGDIETCVGFILGGIGQKIHTEFGNEYNYFVVDRETTKEAIEKAFGRFLSCDEINIIIINQNIAERIRTMVDNHQKIIPVILEIPVNDQPYDCMKENIMKRAKFLSMNHF